MAFMHSHHRPRSHPSRRPHSRPPSHPHPPPREREFVEGVLQLKGKVGFILSEDPRHGDVLVQGPSLRLAMDGDRVRARVTSPAGAPRRAGEIVVVTTRARSTAVGTFKRLGNMAVIATENEGPLVRLLDMGGFSPKVGDVAVARITRWPTGKEMAGGTLTDVLGSRDTPGVDLTAVIRHYELPQGFPPHVEAEARTFGEHVTESAWRAPGRESFFAQRVVTIDGADAKDFDDAVSIEPLNDGWRLGVHIADVAHYVTEGSTLDEEARHRGTSVYFTGTVVPMLPFPLSDNLCSLRPDEIRLTLSCVMDIDREGQVRNPRVVESAIRSARRFTYDEVEVLLTGGELPGLDEKISADVLEMGRLAKLLRHKRFARGSLDFDFPEPDVVTDLKGRPTDIKKRERLEAHRLIEDFMLLANETVARDMSRQPFLYRIHETPDPARLEKLKKSLETLGLRLPAHIDPKHPSALRGVLAQTTDTPLQPVVHLLVLRSLKQAMYSPVNRGHYGLASECYTHFTSPIRRYPDLIVHRLIKDRLHHGGRLDHWARELAAIADHSSKRERVAVEAEREFLDIQKTRLMESRVGETFTGTVSGVTNFGFFVQLDEFFGEGLVHVNNLGNDFFLFDEARMTLRGRRTGRMFAIGQKVKIKLAAANVLKHQLDFELLGGEAGRRPAHRHHHRGHPRRRPR